MLGLGLSLTGNLQSSGLSPSNLFSVPGSRGFFYDFSDYTTQFTDTAGTTPVTGVGQSLALVLDESQGMTPGPELVTNGDFATDTNWNKGTGWTISGGTANTVQPNNLQSISQTGTYPVATYRVQFTVSGYTAGVLTARFSGGGADSAPSVSANGTYTFLITTTGARTQFDILAAGGSGATASIDNISVREIPGNHATQATAGSRALTQVRPMGVERRNMAIGSGAVDNATYWAATNTANGITATKVASGVDTDGLPYADYTVSGTATASTTNVVYARTSSRSASSNTQTWNASFRAQLISGSQPPANCGPRPEIYGETAPTTQNESGVGTAVVSSTDTLNTLSYTMANVATNQAAGVVAIRTGIGDTVNYTVRVKAFQFELGSTRTTYQRVVTANEWYEEGYTSYRGIAFDGVDDFLQTAAIDFAGAESLGPELVTNGTFTSNITGWSDVSSAGGSIAWNAAGYMDIINTTGIARTVQNVTVTSGRAYKLQISNVGATSFTFAVGSTANGTDLLSVTVSAGATVSYTITAITTLLSIGPRNFTTATTASIDNVSVKEVLIPADKMTVVAGVRKLSDAATGTVVELSANPDTTNGSFGMRAPAGANSYVFRAFGTVGPVAVALTGFAAPESAVITGTGDISADSTVIRRNGAAGASLGTDLGTGNYSNSPVFIGRGFGGTANPFNGTLTFLCVINRVLTAAELAQLEDYANGKTGAY